MHGSYEEESTDVGKLADWAEWGKGGSIGVHGGKAWGYVRGER